MSKKYFTLKGFTLIELLIVIGLIAILAGIVFVALDPLTRFRDARNSRRFADVSSMLTAVRVDQVDNGGTYHANVTAMTNDQEYMIASDTGGASCNDGCTIVDSATHCVSLKFLKDEGYIGKVPFDPNTTDWPEASLKTGYYARKNTNNSITMGACDSEGAATIEVTR